MINSDIALAVPGALQIPYAAYEDRLGLDHFTKYAPSKCDQ